MISTLETQAQQTLADYATMRGATSETELLWHVRQDAASLGLIQRIESFAGFELDKVSGLLRLPSGGRVRTTRVEKIVVCSLISAGGEIVTYEDLLKMLGMEDIIGTTTAPRTYICRLRSKIGPPDNELITTVTGVGFRIKPQQST